MPAETDVAIVGAGPVGSALALMLARRGQRVLLMEKTTFPRDKPCGEGLMPSGVAILEELGIRLAPADFPRVWGVRYRSSDGRSAFGAFRQDDGKPVAGAAVRRLKLDPLVAAYAAEHPLVTFREGVALRGLDHCGVTMRLRTSAGDVVARRVVAADGIGSPVRRWMGWERPSRGRRRGLVCHLHHPAHGLEEIVVTILDGTETYVAPTGPDEVLAVVLGDHRRLGGAHASLPQAYRATITSAHPEFGFEPTGPLLSAGPFLVKPRRVAGGAVFLAGDAAGFIDPLTGDGMAAGLSAARELARLLVEAPDTAAQAYQAWHARQWRRRRFVTGLAMTLSRHPALAGRALQGMTRNPAALESLIRLNGGGHPLSSVPTRAWLALVGI
jgi:2-polyprenyl-6-methoxyphenol hydroxylase-like FAD-dependent oxidoreductase